MMYIIGIVRDSLHCIVGFDEYCSLRLTDRVLRQGTLSSPIPERWMVAFVGNIKIYSTILLQWIMHSQSKIYSQSNQFYDIFHIQHKELKLIMNKNELLSSHHTDNADIEDIRDEELRKIRTQTLCSLL